MNIVNEKDDPCKVELVDWTEERPGRFRFGVHIPAIGIKIHDFYWAKTAVGVFRVCGPVIRKHVAGKNIKTWKQLLHFEGQNGARLLGAIGLACEKHMAAGG